MPNWVEIAYYPTMAPGKEFVRPRLVFERNFYGIPDVGHLMLIIMSLVLVHPYHSVSQVDLHIMLALCLGHSILSCEARFT
jgi:hypothetical protein